MVRYRMVGFYSGDFYFEANTSGRLAQMAAKAYPTIKYGRKSSKGQGQVQNPIYPETMKIERIE